MHKIKAVLPGSIAEELGIEPGDLLLSIDDREIEDILDYRFLVDSESMVMLIQKPDGEQWELDIENDYEDPGLEFDTGLMSDYKSCSNKCIFCFIDQMPPGMRETLYFKDDDSRLSFLQGNYITLTNMKERDIDRLIAYRMEPINISIHTTDPELRCRMLHNRFAGEGLRYIDRLCEAGIRMNGQIVLCPGWNDGSALRRTMEDILRWAPCMESVSIVPIGKTKYREGLEPIASVDAGIARETIRLVEEFQKTAMERFGMHLFHASDELYFLAGLEFPEEDSYDGYLQLENGVGMIRLLKEEVREALEDLEADPAQERISIATGRLAAPVMRELTGLICGKLPGRSVTVYEIENEFFGQEITVSGLLTGQDILHQLSGRDLGDRLLLPVNMFRYGEETFLDDMTRTELETQLGVPVRICPGTGGDLVRMLAEPEGER